MSRARAEQRFERAYRSVWGALHRGDDSDVSQHERQLLHHIPTVGGVALTSVADHLALPKSTASILVKDLERRGFLRRTRDPLDERRLAIVLTEKGAARVLADTVLEPTALAAALARLPPPVRDGLLSGLEHLVAILDESARGNSASSGATTSRRSIRNSRST
jgi:MarR family transcriptional regulator, organic hydroperoxide resistance regulator